MRHAFVCSVSVNQTASPTLLCLKKFSGARQGGGNPLSACLTDGKLISAGCIHGKLEGGGGTG